MTLFAKSSGNRCVATFLIATVVLFGSMGSQARVADFYQPLSIPALLDLLQQAGLETKVKTLDGGRQMMPIRLEGRVSVLFLYGCEDADCPEINSIQSLSWVDTKPNPKGEYRQALLQHLNDFNAKYPNGRVYLHPDGRALLETDISIGQGISSGRLASYLGSLAGLQEVFEEHMAEFQSAASPVLTPPEPPPPAPVVRPPATITPTSITPGGSTPVRTDMGSRVLHVRISKLTDGDEGCEISGEIENRGKNSYEFIGAGFIAQLADRDEPFGINAGRDYQIGKQGPGPLRPDTRGGSIATLKGVACSDIQQVLFDDIAYCGNEPPLSLDCSAIAAIDPDGPLPLIDRPNRLSGDPVPSLPAEK